MECVLCTGGKEDCSHLLFERPFAREIWASLSISQAISLVRPFGDLYSVASGAGMALAVLWADWLHCTEVVYSDREALKDGIIQDVESISLVWRDVRCEGIFHNTFNLSSSITTSLILTAAVSNLARIMS